FVIDEFAVGPRAPADIVVVMDDSAGMIPTQFEVSSRAVDFVAPLEGSGFRLGLITTDADTGPPGTLRPLPDGADWIDDTLDDPIAAFQSLVLVGQDGSPTEQGLAALYAMLGPFAPPVTESFLRDEADLHVLVVSDEPDQSVALPTEDYATWLRSVKPPERDVTLSSFVDPEMDAGYAAVTAALGGVRHDLTADDAAWDEAVQAFTATALGRDRARRFTLSAQPVPATLRVTTVRDTGAAQPLEIRFDDDEYTYDAVANEVSFVVFVPDPGDLVRVRYERAP
ncbi:MAG: vWA domain-containing protein, partial [Myxococcota bacterium]